MSVLDRQTLSPLYQSKDSKSLKQEMIKMKIHEANRKIQELENTVIQVPSDLRQQQPVRQSSSMKPLNA